VRIGANIDNQIQVVDGLKAGDRIFIDLPKDMQRKSEDSSKNSPNK
jgi:HlyD family secretion protein